MTWLEPWASIESLGPPDWTPDKIADYRRAWERQLLLEVGPRHALYGRKAVLIARLWSRDDALFLLEDGAVAEVHLTWSKRPEPNPLWPSTAIFPSLTVWAEQVMRPLHEAVVGNGAGQDEPFR